MTYNPSFGSGFRFRLGNGHSVSVWDAYTAYIFFSGKWDLHSRMTTESQLEFYRDLLQERESV